jgi:hypothetical protein
MIALVGLLLYTFRVLREYVSAWAVLQG